ncbi:MrcB family domain-containing protein [Paenibacillus daejeonensis]|uniref:MrcB family domain-containing protein n=1 Tax=Paenibacillus daejeonensis TaxID=135193 RepID=UPI000375A584|nr:DUF3578 domain-containing protein [Paenibacillus daejeonensis]
MPLPPELSTIFQKKNKSYKMVLVLAMLEVWERTRQKLLSMDQVAQQFLDYYRYRESNNQPTDSPPANKRDNWADLSLAQTKALLNTPIEALSEILSKKDQGQVITFHEHIWGMGEDVLNSLKNYANEELEGYNSKLQVSISLQAPFEQIMSTYLEAKSGPFTNHTLGQLVRNTIPNELKQLPYINDSIRIQGSVGMGNWATVPWIALMDKRITETTQHGVYIVYLFAEDMSAVYLTLNQGVTKPLKEKGRKEGYAYLQQKTEELQSLLDLDGFMTDDQIKLAAGGLGRDYQVSTIAYKGYERGSVLSDAQLHADLERLITTYSQFVEIYESDTNMTVAAAHEGESPLINWNVSEQIEHIKSFISSRGFIYPDGLIENFYLSLKTKPFVILAGVSGTGKTKLVKLFAESIGATVANGQYTLIPVRPDWSDASDLLGYKDLSGVYRPGRLAEVLCEAARPENQHKPYFVCLDEMNLARVEHYFSDLLSVLETQEWHEEHIITSPLISSASLTNDDDRARYGELSVPDNVYFIGTVNMDETTHPFSKKVLDRANTIEFNDIRLDQFPRRRSEEGLSTEPSVVSNAFLRSDYLQLVEVFEEFEVLIQDVTARLVNINQILEAVHAHVGFRIRDTVCFYMIYNEREGLLNSDQAFDCQVLQKILPRLQGSNRALKRVLLQLLHLCTGARLSIERHIEDASELYKETQSRIDEGKAKYPQSAQKLAFMLRRLEEDGFTSYWLS